MTETRMRAYVKTAAGPGEQLLKVPLPEPPDAGEVVVKVKATSICGTDLHIHLWDGWSAIRVKPPRIMGHEFTGEVISIGPGVSAVKVGSCVTGESHWTCGYCLQCRLGQQHVCAQTKILGVDVDGCFAEFVKVPQGSLWVNLPDVPTKLACIQDPLGNAVHAVMSGPVAGCRVAVLGCGPIGIFAVAVARSAGASHVFATDLSSYRLKLASELGADETGHPQSDDIERLSQAQTNGIGFDAVFEMSGAPAAIRQAMRICRRGGRVVLMGIPSSRVDLDIAEDMIFKGLEIQCVVGRRLYQTWQTMHELLASGRLNVLPTITHELPFSELPEGMELMRRGEFGKVVFHAD